MSIVHVHLGARSYNIHIGCNLEDNLAEYFPTGSQSAKVCIITDNNIKAHAQLVASLLEKNGVVTKLVCLPSGEDQKCFATLSRLYDELVDFKADRQTIVAAVGGGVIGDLAGFAAATFNRGIRLLMIPTTLLAMVDSSVGGKVGINHPKGKNLIGAFHQPMGVVIHLPFLQTLPDREFYSGLAEVVKYGMIMDEAFFRWLTNAGNDWRNTAIVEHMVETSCRHKATVVQEDEYETNGLRAILNFGHTFAHAIETVAGYGTLLHGEAVSIGMVAACRTAVRMNWFSEQEIDECLIPLLQSMHLPIRLQNNWSVDSLLSTMKHDKKNAQGQLRLVLPRWIGKVESGVIVDEFLVREVLITRLAGPHELG